MDRIFLTVSQVAERLQLTEGTICGWLRNRQLYGFKLSKEWRISPDDLISFLEERANKPQVQMANIRSYLSRSRQGRVTSVALAPAKELAVNRNNSASDAQSELHTARIITSGQPKTVATVTTLAERKLDICEQEATKPAWTPPWRLDDS